MFVQNIFASLAEWQAAGLKTGLATLVHIDGSSPRPRGAQIAVAEDGRHVGVISSGCAEEAIIAEALAALADGTTHISRYGKGSPYLDIVLPCGSGLDILFTGTDVDTLTAQVGAQHAARKTAFVTPDADLALQVSDAPQAEAMAYPPDYHLHIFGAGPHLVCFAQLAQVLGYACFIHSTDQATLAQVKALGLTGESMTHQSRFIPHSFDEHSAVITLFHEHNLEIEILHAALDSQAHFIGALGSRKTHAQRVDLLALREPTARPADEIIGPIGLNIGASDPAEIALSIMAQIVEKRRLGPAK